ARRAPHQRSAAILAEPVARPLGRTALSARHHGWTLTPESAVEPATRCSMSLPFEAIYGTSWYEVNPSRRDDQIHSTRSSVGTGQVPVGLSANSWIPVAK